MNNELNTGSKNVSEKERRNIAENYSMILGKEGNIKYKIIDLQKYAEDVMKRRKELQVPPFVKIKPLYPNKIKSERKSITFVKDRVHDMYYGRFNGFDKHGNPLWNRIDIDNVLELNLNNISDVQIWLVARMHPSIQGSPFESHATYFVEDPLEEALSDNRKAESAVEAFSRINLLKGKELVFFARLIGCEVPEGSSTEIVRGILNKKAFTDPILFNNLFKTKDRGIKELVHTALLMNVIKQTKEGFFFEGMSLGLMKDDIYEFFKEHAQYVKNLTDKVLEEDSITVQIEKEKEESIKEVAAKIKL